MNMEAKEFNALRRSVQTAYGEIAYVEQGSGPVALFVHGVLLNGALWRHVIDGVKSERRCIAIDILGHGATVTPAGADVSFVAQAGMIEAFLDALNIADVDLVANDSGGGIAQIFAANNPARVRMLTLTNCDTHDNYPPPALEGFIGLAKNGQIGATVQRVLDEPEFGRNVLGTGYERPEDLSRETIEEYLLPWLATPEAAKHLERFLTTFDNTQNTSIEPKLRKLQAPTLIVWGTGDVFFDKRWAYWLKDTIPGVTEVIEVPDAKLFFPEERPEALIAPMLKLWKTAVFV
jgi:pimeloyl-ACP methyl ester carboxylesterase